MSDYRCDMQDEAAPRLGCRCRACYRIRERALDPRLLELVNRHLRSLNSVVMPSVEVLQRGLEGYLSGQIDYGALHLGIIEALMNLADTQFELTWSIRSRQAPVRILERAEADPDQFSANPRRGVKP